jgi:F420-non-reducing hydrogenase iron-sulfur subunit
MSTNNFEPVIIVFACHYCAYSAADLAGSARLQYPPNVRIIRTPCTGRLEIDFFMKAFENGADGILVAGCEEGSCHFRDGNLLAKRRVKSAGTLLSEAGIEINRIRMVNVSAASSHKFVEYVKEMVETIKKLGPSPIKNLRI